MQTNGAITIYTPSIEDHETVYYRCKIWGVWVISRNAVQLSTNTVTGGNILIARVPLTALFEKQYVERQEFYTKDPERYFTFMPGILLLRGLAEPSTATKSELMDKYDLVTVTTVNDNRYGRNKHWKLEGSG